MNIQEYELNIKGISHNMYYRIFRNRYVISKVGKDFRTNVLNLFNNIPNKICHAVPVKVAIEFCFKDKRKRDLDNLTKSILDACKKIIYADDSLIYELVTKKISGDCDKIKIKIEVI